MSTYVIALKRDCRAKAPADWVQLVRSVPGVHLVGSENAPVVRIEATSEAVEQLRDQLGTFCNIEPIILHKPS